MLARVRDDTRARGAVTASEIPGSVAPEIAVSMLASMCSFCMVVICLKFRATAKVCTTRFKVIISQFLKIIQVKIDKA